MTFGYQVLTVAVGLKLYNQTGSALDLGLVGLVQALPVLLLAIPGGQIADHFSRKGWWWSCWPSPWWSAPDCSWACPLRCVAGLAVFPADRGRRGGAIAGRPVAGGAAAADRARSSTSTRRNLESQRLPRGLHGRSGRGRTLDASAAGHRPSRPSCCVAACWRWRPCCGVRHQGPGRPPRSGVAGHASWPASASWTAAARFWPRSRWTFSPCCWAA